MRVLATVLAVAMLFVSAAQIATAQEMKGPTITVMGEGSSTAPPDAAVVHVGVTAQARTASAAREQVATRMERVISHLRELHLGDKALQTSRINVSQSYNNKGEIEGFQASYVLKVTITDLEQIAPVIDGAIESGANTVNGPMFTIEDDDALQDQALAKAVADARHKAKAIAQAAGGKLGGLLEIHEQGTQRIQPRRYGAEMMRMAMDASASTPVEAGEIEVRAGVEIVYRLQMN